MAKLSEISEHLINKHTGLSQQFQQEAAEGEESNPPARTLNATEALGQFTGSELSTVGLEGQLKFCFKYRLCDLSLIHMMMSQKQSDTGGHWEIRTGVISIIMIFKKMSTPLSHVGRMKIENEARKRFLEKQIFRSHLKDKLSFR